VQGPEHAHRWCWEDVQGSVAKKFFPERQTVVYQYDNQRYAYWGKFVKAC